MAGANVSKRLASLTYEDFCEAVSRWESELWGESYYICRALECATRYLKKLGQVLPNEEYVVEAAEQTYLRSQELILCLVRVFSFVIDRQDSQVEAINRRCWSPYDGTAWDRFSKRVRASLYPELKTLYEDLVWFVYLHDISAQDEYVESLLDHLFEMKQAVANCISKIAYSLTDEGIEEILA